MEHVFTEGRRACQFPEIVAKCPVRCDRFSLGGFTFAFLEWGIVTDSAEAIPWVLSRSSSALNHSVMMILGQGLRSNLLKLVYRNIVNCLGAMRASQWARSVGFCWLWGMYVSRWDHLPCETYTWVSLYHWTWAKLAGAEPCPEAVPTLFSQPGVPGSWYSGLHYLLHLFLFLKRSGTFHLELPPIMKDVGGAGGCQPALQYQLPAEQDPDFP